MREEKTQVVAVQFDLLGKHRTVLPKGVVMTKFSPGADNYAYEGIEFSCYNEDNFERIYDGNWIIYCFNGKTFVVDDAFFQEHYEVIEL